MILRALALRYEHFDAEHTGALRLFNGFYEGDPRFVIDLYGDTLVGFCHAEDSDSITEFKDEIQPALLKLLPWVNCSVLKRRNAPDLASRRGVIIFGSQPAQQVNEHNVWYAIDLMVNQDASLYLDTRWLRKWLISQMVGKSVLNLFAYTGSLGVAALAGGATLVVQVDRNRRFLDFARQSARLNKFDLSKMELHAIDFFSKTAFYKRSGIDFDCVIIDPPLFSRTEKGTIDLVNHTARVINKVRPLVRDGGKLVVINNALFLSGKDYYRTLEMLCQDDYMTIHAIIPAPQDITGYPTTIINPPPMDPAPFNHPTKIVVLGIRRAKTPRPAI